MTVIVTHRLMLRPHQEAKTLPTIVEWLNDPAVVRYSEQRHHKHSVEFQDMFIRMFVEPSLYREIYLKKKLIGSITARVDEINSVADVGIMIGEKSEWGKGLGYEAWAGFCDHLFSTGIRKIEGGTMMANMGMISIFRKYHMFYEGRRHAHFMHGDEPMDMVLWGRVGG